MKPAPKPAALRRHLAPRQKLWLNWDGVFLMGPNYLRFLAAVDKTGTIREGGQAVGWSYRTCLNHLRRMERVLGAPVLATGGPNSGWPGWRPGCCHSSGGERCPVLRRQHALWRRCRL